ncbi:hypothetical protein QE390_000137 [Siphonobacter sp. SORGH_AS 1065]|nr:hypothetical protein [Siphonobacter sp. SORGH_AS_1065]
MSPKFINDIFFEKYVAENALAKTTQVRDLYANELPKWKVIHNNIFCFEKYVAEFEKYVAEFEKYVAEFEKYVAEFEKYVAECLVSFCISISYEDQNRYQNINQNKVKIF